MKNDNMKRMFFTRIFLLIMLSWRLTNEKHYSRSKASGKILKDGSSIIIYVPVAQAKNNWKNWSSMTWLWNSAFSKKKYFLCCKYTVVWNSKKGCNLEKLISITWYVKEFPIISAIPELFRVLHCEIPMCRDSRNWEDLLFYMISYIWRNSTFRKCHEIFGLYIVGRLIPKFVHRTIFLSFLDSVCPPLVSCSEIW